MINGGRCPVSVEELWITVVCPIRLHDLLEQRGTAADWTGEKHKNALVVKGVQQLLTGRFVHGLQCG